MKNLLYYEILVQNHFEAMPLRHNTDLDIVLDDMVYHDVITWEEVESENLQDNLFLKEWIQDIISDYIDGRFEL